MNSEAHPPVVTTGAVRLFTINDVADILGCGRTLVYDLIGRGEIGHVKIGRLTRIHPAQVDLYLKRRMGLDRIDPPAPTRRKPRQNQAALPF